MSKHGFPMTTAYFSKLPLDIQSHIASFELGSSLREVSKDCRKAHDQALKIYPYKYFQSHPNSLTGQLFQRIQVKNPNTPLEKIIQKTFQAARAILRDPHKIALYDFAAIDRTDDLMIEQIKQRLEELRPHLFDGMEPSARALDYLQVWFDSPKPHRFATEELIADALILGRGDCLRALLTQLDFQNLGQVTARTFSYRVCWNIIHSPEFEHFTPEQVQRTWLQAAQQGYTNSDPRATPQQQLAVEQWFNCLKEMTRLGKVAILAPSQVVETLTMLKRSGQSRNFLIEAAPIATLRYLILNRDPDIIKEIISTSRLAEISYEELRDAFAHTLNPDFALALIRKGLHV